MARIFACTKCPKKFKSMQDYLNPEKHGCLRKSDKVPPPREEKS